MEITFKSSFLDESNFVLQPDTEVEARFGIFGPRGKFESRVNPILVRRAKEALSEMIGWEPEPQLSTVVRFLGEDQLRAIVPHHDISIHDIDKIRFHDDVCWESKRKIKHVDYPDIGLRIGLSTEIAENIPSKSVSLDLMRQRTRYSYELPDLPFVVDITSVVTIDAEGNKSNLDYFCNELEIEYTGDHREFNNYLPDFYAFIERMWFILYESDVYYTRSEFDAMRSNTLDLIRTPEMGGDRISQSGRDVVKQYLAKPRSIKTQDLTAEGLYGLGSKGPYYVTYKTDGVRALLVGDDSGIWLYYPPIYENMLARREKGRKYTHFILDGEYLHDQRVFVPFDLISWRLPNRPPSTLINEKYRDRLRIMNALLNKFDVAAGSLPIEVRCKEIHLLDRCHTSEGMNELARFIDDRHDQDYATDGLIFTPADHGYHMFKTRAPPLPTRILHRYPDIVKWKEESQLTIDFLVKRVSGLSMHNGYELYAFDDVRGTKSDVLFTGTNEYPLSSGMVDTDNEIMHSITHPTIVEFQWNGEQLVPIKIRDDKSSQNGIAVSQDNWNTLRNPITRTSLLQGYVRAPHAVTARIKELIYRISLKIIPKSEQDLTLMEVGAGLGGDLKRWSLINPSRIIAIDPDDVKLDELVSRVSSQDDNDYKLDVLAYKGEDIELYERVRDNRITLSSSMLSASFFSESPNRLARFFNLMVLAPTLQIYSITVQGLEKAIGPRSQWIEGESYDVYPARVRIINASNPVTIGFTHMSSATIDGEQIEYPLDVDNARKHLHDLAYDTKITDLTKVYQKQIPSVRRYLDMYQVIHALRSKTREANEWYPRDLPVGEYERLGLTTSNSYCRCRVKATGLFSSVISSVPSLRANVIALEKKDPQLATTRRELDQEASSLVISPNLWTRVDRHSSKYGFYFIVADAYSGTILHNRKSSVTHRGVVRIVTEQGSVHYEVMSRCK